MDLILPVIDHRSSHPAPHIHKRKLDEIVGSDLNVEVFAASELDIYVASVVYGSTREIIKSCVNALNVVAQHPKLLVYHVNAPVVEHTAALFNGFSPVSGDTVVTVNAGLYTDDLADRIFIAKLLHKNEIIVISAVLMNGELSVVSLRRGDHILKVIIETCQLTEEEKIRMCRLVTEAGADYIKTSTGFSTGGATREDVKLLREHVGAEVKVKAAGGISSLVDAEDMIALGADRLGTSRVVRIVKDGTAGDAKY